MMRLSGFVLGALLTLGIFLLVLDGGHAPPAVSLATGSETERLPAPDGPEERGVGVEEKLDIVPREDLQPAEENQQLLDPLSWNQSVMAFEAASEQAATEPARYPVWSPFRSEWAARGFARRLAQATDVPVEVISEGAGNYQVVFSYRDASERQALVEQIEAVTGLELEQTP